MARGAPGYFDIDERLGGLSAKGDDLERMKSLIDFEAFHPALEATVHVRIVRKADARRSIAVLILQAMHSLSDERCE